MSYCNSDFSESIDRVGIKPSDVERVIGAWGAGSGMGGDPNDDQKSYRWAESSPTEWAGGFLLKLRDDRFAYLQGWNDYTGWGCQDGVEVQYFEYEPAIDDLRAPKGFSDQPPPATEWDIEPADLNKWLADSIATASEEAES